MLSSPQGKHIVILPWYSSFVKSRQVAKNGGRISRSMELAGWGKHAFIVCEMRDKKHKLLPQGWVRAAGKGDRNLCRSLCSSQGLTWDRWSEPGAVCAADVLIKHFISFSPGLAPAPGLPQPLCRRCPGHRQSVFADKHPRQEHTGDPSSLALTSPQPLDPSPAPSPDQSGTKAVEQCQERHWDSELQGDLAGKQLGPSNSSQTLTSMF